MIRTLSATGAVLVTCCGPLSLLADTPPVQTTVATDAALGEADSQAEFDRQYEMWNQAMAEIRQLRDQYQQANPQQRAALKGDFLKKVQAVRNSVPALKAAATAAYRAAPNARAEVTDFLMSAVGEDVSKDDYEAAAEAAALLQEHHTEDAATQLMAGVVAFCTNDFEGATAAFARADELGAFQSSDRRVAALAQQAAQYRSLLGEYRRFWKKEQEIRAAEAEADDLPRVKLVTNKGEMIIELFENEAPIATANFVSLVEKGYYDGLKFHRVLPGFMAQGGCPQGTGTGGPGYNIPCECQQANHRKHFRGSLSMAHAGPNTGGSQFFLTFVPTSHLNGKHTVFGRVVEGLDVLAKLQRRQPDSPIPADVIQQAKVLRKRAHEYLPTKS